MLTDFIEKVMANKTYATILGVIAMVAPIYFLKTLYAVWFGPAAVLIGFKIERTTWLVMTVVDGVGFLTTLPSREKGRVIQVVMGLWTLEMGLVYLATLLR